MRILFMGTSEFAIPTLQALVAHPFEIIGVVTQPDSPKGRGQRLMPTPIKAEALRYKLTVYQPEKVRRTRFLKTLKQLAPDIIVVAAFGQLLPQAMLDIPPCGTINLHPSLLPKYRGAAPIQWALINGETETGVTMMLVDAGEDTGDIICQERIQIGVQETAVRLTDSLAHLGAKSLVRVLEEMPPNRPPAAFPQNPADATHAPRLTKEMGHINWQQGATDIHNLIRGTAIWPGAYTFLPQNLRLKVLQSLPQTQTLTVPPGTLRIENGQTLLVATGKGTLQILKIQPATKKAMDARDFINGYQLRTGNRFL